MLGQGRQGEQIFSLGQSWPRRIYCIIVAIISLASLSVGTSLDADAQSTSQPANEHKRFCPLVESVAHANDLPLEFFVGVIWQESRFHPEEVGPVTRNGQRAQGIAQFMPETAMERGLLDPLNPSEALPKSGALLAELRTEFGNLGLAAAAYNAGPQRVTDYLAGLRDLPRETRQYVLAITGHPVEMWKNFEAKWPTSSERGTKSCEDLIALLEKNSARTANLPERNVPSWCQYLNHPNAHMCGGVHAKVTMIPHSKPQRRPRVSRASVH